MAQQGADLGAALETWRSLPSDGDDEVVLRVDDDDHDTADDSMLPQTPGLGAAVVGPAGDPIRVFVRVRPPNAREASAPSKDYVRLDSTQNTVQLATDPPRAFTFDGVLGGNSSQQEVFDVVSARVGEACLNGYNGSVYVYGPTGSGKTFTMQGPVTTVQSMRSDDCRGLMCRLLEHIFGEVSRLRNGGGSVEYHCKCSYLEIYKEQITDLLEAGSTNLQVREDINRGVYVERLSEHSVWTLPDALHVLWKGLHQRHVGCTQMNKQSSRSHAVFTLVMEATGTEADGVTSTRTARLNLIDLAGSERQSFDPHGSVTNESLRVKEASAINKSLSVLTNVIMSLSTASQTVTGRNSTGGGKRPYIRYRDSRLTFILRDSLGGNSKTTIIGCVSPSALCFGETLSTLKFCSRAKFIRCAAVLNEEYSGTVESLMLEVKSLKQQLELLSSRGLIPGGVGTSSEASFAGAATLGRRMFDGKDSKMATALADEEDDAVRDLIASGSDELRRLYGPRRGRRLEILLAGALDRERRSDFKRLKLQHFTQYLNGLVERKEKYFDSLREYFAYLVDQTLNENCYSAEIRAELVAFRHQMCSQPTEKMDSLLPDLRSGDLEPESFLIRSGTVASISGGLSPQGSLQRLAGTGLGSRSFSLLTGKAARRGTSQLQQRSPSGRFLTGSLGDSPSSMGIGSPISTIQEMSPEEEELVLLRQENRLLRRQLENHPELLRLGAENRLLREHLATAARNRAMKGGEPRPRSKRQARRANIGGDCDGATKAPSLLDAARKVAAAGDAESRELREGLMRRPFPGIEEVTQISPSSSCGSTSEDSDSDQSASDGATGGAGSRSRGMPAMVAEAAAQLEELLRHKEALEDALKQVVREEAHSASKASLVAAGSRPSFPRALSTLGIEVEPRMAQDILRGSEAASRTIDAMLLKCKGETLLLSTGGRSEMDDYSGDAGMSPRKEEGLDERDVFMSLMKSLPSPSMTRYGVGASSAPQFSVLSSLSSAGRPGLERGPMAATVATLRPSSSTDSANSRMMRNRSMKFLPRIPEQRLGSISPRDDLSSSAGKKTPSPRLPGPPAALSPDGPPPDAEALNVGQLLREATAKVNHLKHQLEHVNDSYRDYRDKLQPLQQEYLTKHNECAFLEAQCKRLDMHCRLLEERALVKSQAGEQSPLHGQVLTGPPPESFGLGGEPTLRRSASSGGSASKGSQLWLTGGESPLGSQGSGTPCASMFASLQSPDAPAVSSAQLATRGLGHNPPSPATAAGVAAAVARHVAATTRSEVRSASARGGPKASGHAASSGPGMEMPPRGLLYAASVSELNLERVPGAAPSASASCAPDSRMQAYIRRVASAPHLPSAQLVADGLSIGELRGRRLSASPSTSPSRSPVHRAAVPVQPGAHPAAWTTQAIAPGTSRPVPVPTSSRPQIRVPSLQLGPRIGSHNTSAARPGFTGPQRQKSGRSP